MAMIMGAGFPAYRGGLLRYADKIGLDNLVDKLNRLSDKYGEKFVPSKLLLELQKTQGNFYN